MKRNSTIWSISFLIVFIFCNIACSSQGTHYTSPPGYDLEKGEKIIMPESLLEISGITFRDGDNTLIFAEQDEDGRLYYLRPGDQKARSVKFAKGGDYEDLAIWQNTVFILRSDGTLFSFPLRMDEKNIAEETVEYKKILPKGEYEGLFADALSRQLFVLCKNCHAGKGHAGAYVFSLDSAALTQPRELKIDLAAIEKKLGKKKGWFQPSAFARNPLTGKWYILSSVNKLLVVAGADWRVEDAFPLNPLHYHQPEGIAFDNSYNLYISNEGDKIKNGNVIKIASKVPK